MSSICSDIFNINIYKLKHREKHKSYNYIYTYLYMINVEYIVIIRINYQVIYLSYQWNFLSQISVPFIWSNMTNYNVLVHYNIKTSITLFNIGIIAEFWFISW